MKSQRVLLPCMGTTMITHDWENITAKPNSLHKDCFPHSQDVGDYSHRPHVHLRSIGAASKNLRCCRKRRNYVKLEFKLNIYILITSHREEMNLSTSTLEPFYNQSSLPKPRNETAESYVYFNGRDYSLSVFGRHKNKTINFNILHQNIVIMLK